MYWTDQKLTSVLNTLANWGSVSSLVIEAAVVQQVEVQYDSLVSTICWPIVKFGEESHILDQNRLKKSINLTKMPKLMHFGLNIEYALLPILRQFASALILDMTLYSSLSVNKNQLQ